MTGADMAIAIAGAPGAALPLSAAIPIMEGVVMTRSEPLPAGPLAQSAMPATVAIAVEASALGTAAIRDFAATGWKIDRVGVSTARIDLEGYRLTIDDARAELVLDNMSSGESARVWGHAALEANGVAVGQFWGTTSLELANGILITCGTAPSPDNGNLYQLDRLTITRGLNALVVTAIGDADGDMRLKGTTHNLSADDETSDGLVIVQTADGCGWVTEDGEPVDAATLMLTAPGALLGPGTPGWSQREFGRLISRFVDIFVRGSAMSMANATLDFRRSEDVDAANVRAAQRRAALANAMLSGGTMPRRAAGAWH